MKLPVWWLQFAVAEKNNTGSKRHRNGHNGCCPTGFSLIEIMIVVALVALLLLLAYPSYSQYQQRSYRAVATGDLLQAAICQQRLLATSGAFDPGRCLPVDSDRYRYRYASGIGSDAFILTATPTGPQITDPCGELSLDHTGLKGSQTRHQSVAQCWSAR